MSVITQEGIKPGIFRFNFRDFNSLTPADCFALILNGLQLFAMYHVIILT